MSIHFHFCEFFATNPLIETIELNKNCTKKIFDKFQEGKQALFNNQNILFFFNDKSRLNGPNPLGSMFMRDSFDYIYFKKEFPYEIRKILNFSNYKFIIYISKEIAESDDEIFKSLTIAHELQHVMQEINFCCITNKDTLLKKYFRLKDLYEFSNYLNHPTEIDAFIKAKEITCNLFGEKELEDFLKKQISKWDSLLNKTKDTYSHEKWGQEKQYWQYIKNLDVKKSYHLRNEFEKLWNRYQTKIEDDLPSIKNDLEENKIDLILAYDIYSSACS